MRPSWFRLKSDRGFAPTTQRNPVARTAESYTVSDEWALEDSNLRPQPCESDSGTRTGWFPTARDGSTRDDQDGSSDPIVAEARSCGAFCGARNAHCQYPAPMTHPPLSPICTSDVAPVVFARGTAFIPGWRKKSHPRTRMASRDTGLLAWIHRLTP
jgi:hypothetical protein